jgi:broad specificity phosphatase PhoE
VTTILLVRHGETDWNRERRFQGHANPPLNAVGRRQAHELAQRLESERVDAVYASDLRRAHETAAIVAVQLDLPVTTVPALREVDVGEWEGLTVDEIQKTSPEGLERWRKHGLRGWEGGESFEALAGRMVGALQGIAAGHPRETALVISHGAAIRACRAHAAGVDYAASRRLFPGPLGNCDLVELRVEDGALSVDSPGNSLAS